MEGQPCMVTMQMADVGTPIWSVKELVAKGSVVVFRKKGGYIKNPETGFKTFFKERQGVYYIKMAIEDPDVAEKWKSGEAHQEHPGETNEMPEPKSGFARHG